MCSICNVYKRVCVYICECVVYVMYISVYVCIYGAGRQWVALTDITDKHEGIQGYLKCSVVVLGPDDEQFTHTRTLYVYICVCVCVYTYTDMYMYMYMCVYTYR